VNFPGFSAKDISTAHNKNLSTTLQSTEQVLSALQQTQTEPLKAHSPIALATQFICLCTTSPPLSVRAVQWSPPASRSMAFAVQDAAPAPYIRAWFASPAPSVLANAHREQAKQAVAHARVVPVEAYAMHQYGLEQLVLEVSVRRTALRELVRQRRRRTQARVRAHAEGKLVSAR